MLDVITDFWKPVKKPAGQEKPDMERLYVGTSVTFGTAPQALISGQRFTVSAINTYQFGDEKMTAYVLTGAGEESVSLIVASAEGEQYLAISRRISFADRMRMFDPAELDAVVEQPEATRLVCREIDANWKHWLVSHYKKEISGMRGAMTKGDLRDVANTAVAQPFDYMLLTSDNNEYAIEVERYADGRLELYATIYRRVSDIVELENPAPPAPALEVVQPQPVSEEIEPLLQAQAAAPAVIESQETAPPVAEAQPVQTEEMPAITVPPATSFPTFNPSMKPKETSPMQTAQAANGNGVYEQEKSTSSNIKPEIKAVSTRTHELENDAIECELRVANKVIDEAIRNEMRLSDVVRRIIALPVANPESVHIPITLTDSDYQLLGIRYGLNATDRNAIKTRIIEEINDFSGKK